MSPLLGLLFQCTQYHLDLSHFLEKKTLYCTKVNYFPNPITISLASDHSVT